MAEVGVPVSGTQHVLEVGDQRAVIASVGASLRSYRVAERDLVIPFGADELRPNFRGATVAPWPNRVVDGRYGFEGERYQLPLTEVDRGHALHGFTPWLDFVRVPAGGTAVSTTEAGAAEVVLRAVIEPQAGYPWRVEIETVYALAENGLTQSVTARNLSGSAAPYGVCPHPYLRAGDGPLDEWVLTSPASRVLSVSEPRLVPTGLLPVDADPERFDFRAPRAIGSAKIDHAFTGLARDAAGFARVELRAADGRGVAMVWGPECAWLQLHTADLPGVPASQDRLGLAVEPMSCAPDAFNSGSDLGLVVLIPGAEYRAIWRIEPLRGA